MASVSAADLITLALAISKLIDDVKTNKRESKRLAERIMMLVPAIEKIPSGYNPPFMEDFRRLLTEIEFRLEKFGDRNYLQKMWKRSSGMVAIYKLTQSQI
jgi:hypothetical protein